MDVYQISVDLKPGVRDTQFVAALDSYLGELKSGGKIEGWRLLRRKLGLGMPGLGEFQILIETRDLAQLDAAFTAASSRDEPVEGAHHGVNSLVQNFQAALYRDYPDPHRKHGEERF
ncbi:MAG: hypothetical protein EON61_04990 [Alphaproteobacteria bacterium]|jgi:hypothetical protein|nr:MAG: hypothetical protein EON61_04990 [Alphaproteobacteria bacterium]